MEVLYCLSEKDDNNEYKEHGIFNSFESALITIYDNGLYKFNNLMKEIGAHRSEEYLENLKEINTIRKDYTPDDVTYLFSRKFRISRVKSYLTNKTALKNILTHINLRFLELSKVRTNKKICFPLQIMSEKHKRAWFDIDRYNANEVIKYLETHVQNKIDEFKIINPNIQQGILERNNSDFVAVRFTDSQEFIFNKEIFAITLSPISGYEMSLEYKYN